MASHADHAMVTYYLSAHGKQKISPAVSSRLSDHAKQSGRISLGLQVLRVHNHEIHSENRVGVIFLPVSVTG